MSKSIAFEQGRKAASLGVALESSGLVNLNPDSDRYWEFIDGYDSYEQDKESK